MELADSFADIYLNDVTKLGVGQTREIKIIQIDDIKDISAMMRYIDYFRNSGLDIDHGNARYGYKMPLPKKGDVHRSLLIFRRW